MHININKQTTDIGLRERNDRNDTLAHECSEQYQTRQWKKKFKELGCIKHKNQPNNVTRAVKSWARNSAAISIKKDKEAPEDLLNILETMIPNCMLQSNGPGIFEKFYV